MISSRIRIESQRTIVAVHPTRSCAAETTVSFRIDLVMGAFAGRYPVPPRRATSNSD